MSISRGARMVARFVRYGLAAPTAAGARCTRRVGCAIWKAQKGPQLQGSPRARFDRPPAPRAPPSGRSDRGVALVQAHRDR